MTNEPSPRPWRVGESLSGTMSCIHDANGEHIASCFGMPTEADAALIVDAVNERDRLAAEEARYRTQNVVLRNIARRMANTLEHVSNEHRFDFYELVREARAAIGEGENLYGKGVGR